MTMTMTPDRPEAVEESRRRRMLDSRCRMAFAPAARSPGVGDGQELPFTCQAVEERAAMAADGMPLAAWPSQLDEPLIRWRPNADECQFSTSCRGKARQANTSAFLVTALLAMPHGIAVEGAPSATAQKCTISAQKATPCPGAPVAA